MFKITDGVPQVLYLGDQESAWDTPRFVATWSRYRLGYLKFYDFVVKIPVGIAQVLWLRGISQVWWLRRQNHGWDTSSSVMVSLQRSRNGMPQILWLRGQDPGRDTSSFMGSWSGFRKFCGFVV